MVYNNCTGKAGKMFYFDYVQRPSYALLKTNPKEYWEQWKDYTKARLNQQVWETNIAFDRRALLSMRMNGALNGLPCTGCTLGGGMGLFF